MSPNISRRIGAAVFTLAIALPSTRAQNGRPSAGSAADACAQPEIEDYDLGLHVAAIFIVMIGSLLGILLPLCTKGHRGRVWTDAFFLARHFGTGVILATAFIHLLFESFVELSSPCIALAYQPTAPAISMAAVFMVTLVDFFVQRRIVGLNCDVDPLEPIGSAEDKLASLEIKAAQRQAIEQRQKYLDLLIIEGGIVFHSVMVGLGLGVADNSGLVGYLIAIVFHQFCDGLAIGTRMALIDFESMRRKRVMLVLAYTFVTPVGIAVGVGVRTVYNGNDASTILAIGTLNSLSAGILLYGALVDLLAKDVLCGPLVTEPLGRVLVAFAAMLSGAGIMAFIGQYA